jgi:general secretion pathway protein C
MGPATRGVLTLISRGGSPGGTSTGQADLVLLGTVIGSFRETFALIQRAGSKEERVFRLGDKVFDNGELVSVKKESAEILSGGRRLKIFTPTASSVTATTSSPAPGQLPVSSTTAAPASFTIDQRALNAALDNIGQTMTDARLLPSSRDGRVEGFRVSEVRPSGVFAMVGIKNGDLLQRVNDFSIDSPEKAIQSFVSLKGQSRIKLDLVRDGQPTTLNYDIR